ncbi:MAG: hypothetical protein ABI373_04055 [Flavobacteriales bacterium]
MRILFAALVFCVSFAVDAQNAIFRTYKEYVDSTGLPVQGVIDVVPRMGRFVVTYKKDGSEERIPCKKVWGFRYNNILFRIEPEGDMPVRLMSHGAVYYWENGFAHLHMQHDSTEASSFEYGRAAYLSKTIQSAIVPASFNADDTSSASAKFRDANPAYASMISCIGEGSELDSVRQCVVEYEVDVEEGKASMP